MPQKVALSNGTEEEKKSEEIINFVHSRMQKFFYICVLSKYLKTLLGDVSVRYVMLRPNRNTKVSHLLLRKMLVYMENEKLIVTKTRRQTFCLRVQQPQRDRLCRNKPLNLNEVQQGPRQSTFLQSCEQL